MRSPVVETTRDPQPGGKQAQVFNKGAEEMVMFSTSDAPFTCVPEQHAGPRFQVSLSSHPRLRAVTIRWSP